MPYRNIPAIPSGLSLVLCLAISAPVVSAQEADQETGGSMLQEVVVTATKSDQSLSDLPNNVSVMTRADVENSAALTVDQLLRQIPGFNMLRQQDSMAAAPVTQVATLRGIGGTAASRSLVMLDGIPIHDAFASQVYWARVPRHQIERIEVVRGGGSTLWGNRTIGGVINIISQEPRAGGLDFTGALGTSETVDLSASASHVIDDWAFSGNANYSDTDGYFNIPDDQRDPANVEVSREAANFGGRAEYAWTNQLDVYLRGNWLDQERQDNTPQNVDYTEVVSVGTGGQLTTAGGSNWQLNLFADLAERTDPATRISSDGTTDQVTQLVDQDGDALGANLGWSKATGTRHRFSAGIDYLWADADVGQSLDYVDGSPTRSKEIRADQQLFGVFVQDEFSLSEAWEIIASGRFDYVANDGSSVDTDAQIGEFLSAEDFDDNSETTFNPSLGFRYRVNDTWSLRGTAYGGFRAAILRELYTSALISSRAIHLKANPDLAPEELRGIEGGVDYSMSDTLLVRATLFHNIVDNVIQNVTIDTAGDTDEVIEPCGLVPAGFVCQQLQNVAEVNATGLEMEVEYRPHPDWRLFASYLLQDVEITEALGQPQLVGNKLRQSADDQFTAKVQYANAKLFEVTVQGRYVGKRFENDLNTLEVDDFFLVDLVLSRSLSDSFRLFLSAENLLDEEYEVAVNSRGGREIGRDRFVSLGLRYSR